MEQGYIVFENVTKTYHAGDVEVQALKNASFCVEKGEICVIVGESGAGKTTLLNILGGMDTLTAGKVTVDGTVVSDMKPKQLTDYRRVDVGFVFQFYNLIPNLTALENVEIAAQLCKDALSPEKVLCQVGLGERQGNFPAQLSGGEQQRVALARAMANNPRIIIADEPTGNIDPKMSMEIMSLLKRINDCNKTVIVVTHARDLVDQMHQRVVTIRNGTVIEDRVGGMFNA